MLANPSLYSSLLQGIMKCDSEGEIREMEKLIQTEYNKLFNLTVFEYRELRESVDKRCKKLNCGNTNLELDFWSKRFS